MMRFATSVKWCIVFAICCLVACKKEGDNQNLDPNKQVENDYMSTKAGSWWMFGTSDSAIFIRRATGLDSMKKGLKFSYYITIDTTAADADTTPEYFGKNDGKYLSLIDIDGTETNYAIAVLLKDSASTGTTWTNTQTLFTVYDVKIESKVVSTGETMVLNGKTYNNVTKVHNDLGGRLSVDINGAYADCGTMDIWFGRGIGIIKQYVDVHILETYKLKHQDSILDYHIEP